MSEDRFTETTTQSWGGRMGDSIKGVLVGIVLFLASFVLLFWNEGRAVRMAKDIAEGESNVVSVAADKVDKANEGKLVHVSGPAATTDTLADDQFGVSVSGAVKLARVVEMYQWAEDKKTEKKRNVGGSETTTTTYSYKRDWSSGRIDSDKFNKSEGHENPSMPFQGETWTASRVALGAFQMTPALVGKMNKFDNRPATQGDLERVPADWRGRARLDGGVIYLPHAATSQPEGSPRLGDLRVQFKVAPAGPVSVIGRQVAATFEPYTASGGNKILELAYGTVSAKEMFAQMAAQNKMLTWILRLVGFLAMAIGVGLVLRPLATMADVLPFLGDLMRLGTGLVAVVVALPLSLLTIAIAWLFYRPLLGIGLLVVAVGIIVLAKMAAARRRPKPA